MTSCFQPETSSYVSENRGNKQMLCLDPKTKGDMNNTRGRHSSTTKEVTEKGGMSADGVDCFNALFYKSNVYCNNMWYDI